MTDTATQTKDNRYLTILSVVSIFAVIVLHVNDGTFGIFDGSIKWASANVIECIFYFAIPVLFMITGATLMDYRKQYDTKTFIKKLVCKTVIPFWVWSLIGLILYTIKGVYTLDDFSFQFFLDGFINTKFNHTYWFFVSLFVCCIWMIVLSLIPEEHKQKAFLCLIIGGFITTFLLRFLFNLLDINYNSCLAFPVQSGYLIYVLLGYYVHKYNLKLCTRIIIYCLGFAGLLTQLLGTHFASFNAGTLVETFTGQLNAPCLLYSLAIFTFFRYFKPNKFFNFIHKICKFFAPMTLGIYLIHSLTLRLLLEEIFDTHDILFRTFGAVGTFLLCAAIVWIIQRIPLVKKLIPK